MDFCSTSWSRASSYSTTSRLNHAAALAALGAPWECRIVWASKSLPAALAMIPVDRAVELQHISASRGLVQAVDILGDHRQKPPPVPIGPSFCGRD